MMVACPCCGNDLELPSDPKRIAAYLPLTPRERKMFDHFAHHMGQPVMTAALVEAMYGDDPNGGPKTAELCVRRVLFFLRKKVAPFGFSIEATIGRGAYRRMVYLPKFTEKQVLRLRGKAWNLEVPFDG